MKTNFVQVIITIISISTFSLSSYGQLLGVVKITSSKLRDCPSLDCNIISEIDSGHIFWIENIENIENISNYGANPWLKVTMCKNTSFSGYIYGALVRQAYDNELRTLEQPLDLYGTIDYNSNVNVRDCGSIHCNQIFRLSSNDSFKILGVTNYQQNIFPFGSHPWYRIQFNNTEGYLFGALVKRGLAIDYTKIITTQPTDIYTSPNANAVISLNTGEQLAVIHKSNETEVKHPYSRQYWYQVLYDINNKGWVYGGYTNAYQNTVHNCQCVDYLKHSLGIKGASEHALNWSKILTRNTQMNIHGLTSQMSYSEIILDNISFRDIAIFDKMHPQADNNYGHIGYIIDIRLNKKGISEVLIEGANHKNINSTFVKHRCSNVSFKWYTINEHVKFYQKKR